MSITKCCEVCSAEFVPYGKVSKYCSTRCRSAAYWKRLKADPIRLRAYYDRQIMRLEDTAKRNKKNASYRARMKTAYWREWRKKHIKSYRHNTIVGRLVSLNMHVRERGQSNLIIDAEDVRLKFGNIEDWTCAYCGTDSNLSFDHILALSLGGRHTIDNLQILCRPCNARKGAQEKKMLKALRNSRHT